MAQGARKKLCVCFTCEKQAEKETCCFSRLERQQTPVLEKDTKDH